MKISTIIPVYNEEHVLPELIQFLKKCEQSDKNEIIIVDGGSTDRTVEIAESLDVSVIESTVKGRAAQMNAGAEFASNEILYFLHADTIPPKNFIPLIHKQFKAGFKAGCFRLAFDYEHPILKFYAWFTRFDVDTFRFGDQSLFVEKSVFENAGRFDEQLIVMEDQIIVKNLKRISGFTIIPEPVTTSARKYRENGIIRLQLVFSTILIMFYLKVPQNKLVSFYRKMIN